MARLFSAGKFWFLIIIHSKLLSLETLQNSALKKSSQLSLLPGVSSQRLAPLQVLSCFSWILLCGKVSAEFFSLKGAKQVIKLVLKEPLAPTFCGTHSQVSLSLWNKIHKHSSLSLWKAYSTSDCFL